MIASALAAKALPAAADAERIRALPCQTPDQEIQAESLRQPIYPLVAVLLCQEGRVTLEFSVQPDGRTDRIEVMASEPADLFDAAAREAISRWRFQPRCRAGEAVARRATQTIEFKLPEAASGACPQLDDPEALGLLSELASHYSLLAEQVIAAPDRMPDWSRPAPQFGGDLGRIEAFHHDVIDRQMSARQRAMDEERAIPALDAGLIASDPRLRETLSMLDRWRTYLESEIESYATELEIQRAEARRLNDQVNVTPEVWQALVTRFQPDPEQAAEMLARMREQVDQALADARELVEFLDRHRDQWRPWPDQPWLPLFENPALAEQDQALRQQAMRSIEALTAPAMENLLMWSRPEL